MYSFSLCFSLSPWYSNVSLHLSSCSSASALLCSQMTRSSANNITHGGSFPISVCSTSMISIKSSGLIADPWCNSTPTREYSVSPALVDTRVSQALYIYCIIVTYPSGTPFFRRHHHIKSRGTLSYAFSKSTKTMWSSLFISLYFSWIIRSMNIGSVVDFPGRKPYYVLPIDVIGRSLASINRSHIFIDWHISLMSR